MRSIGPARIHIGAIERAKRTPYIGASDRLAPARGTTLTEVFRELESDG